MTPKQKLWWIIGIIFLISLISNMAIKPQAIVPDLSKEGCFVKEDCYKPITTGYCNVKFDCVIGKCSYEDVRCPEECGIAGDEDLDGLSDCNDNDCWNSPYCHCSIMEYQDCKSGNCFCPEPTKPHWLVENIGYCVCS